MSNSALDVSYEGVEKISDAMERFGKGSGQIIQGVFNEFGGYEIADNIIPFIHPSGRTFKGHRIGARAAGSDDVFQHTVNELSLVVRSVGRFGYLYFPDDGSNTKKHAGNQQFMVKGAEKAAPKIIDRCVAKLTEEF